MPYTDEALVARVLEKWKPTVVRHRLERPDPKQGLAFFDGHQTDRICDGAPLNLPTVGVSIEQTGGSRYAPATNIRELLFPGGNFK